MLLYLDEVSEAHKLSNVNNLWKNMFKNITACHSLHITLLQNKCIDANSKMLISLF